MPGQRGQTFEPFRFLIGAVLALLILVIIVGAINYFSDLRHNVSLQRFYDGIENSAKQPNGETLMIENVQFERDDRFTSDFLGAKAGLKQSCLEFHDSGAPGFDVGPGLLVVEESVLVDVFVRCETNLASTSELGFYCDSGYCGVCCEVAFGEEFG